MNYNIIAIVYIITLILITLKFSDKYSLNAKCQTDENNTDKDKCIKNLRCTYDADNTKCKEKLNENAKYLLYIFGLLIFYLVYSKLNLSYLFSDHKFRKMILIIPFFYIFILIIIYIYLDIKDVTGLIFYNVGIMILYYINICAGEESNKLNNNLLNVIISTLVIIGILLFLKQSMLVNKLQLKKDNCTNKLRQIPRLTSPNEITKSIINRKLPDKNIDTCHSLEELQELYNELSSQDEECSFCVDYVDNKFKCQTNSYCNQNMKKIYDEECKNSKGDIKALINPYVKEYNDDISADKNTDYILECNELNSQIPNLIEVDVTTESKVSDLIAEITKKIKIRDGYNEVFKFENDELDKDKTLAQSNIKNKSIIDLSFIHT
jgi:hypothetical protein